jgi:uncharacterized protein YjgD (DUF1641 family)
MDKLIISVDEARKLLDKSEAQMTDQEIEKLISDLDSIARLYIKGVREGAIKLPSEIPKNYCAKNSVNPHLALKLLC